MGTQERRSRQKVQLRQRILDAARELFIRRGYENVSMRQIAQEIEYSPTAIYLHFKDKEALFRELCATDFLAFAKIFQKIALIKDPVERLRKIGEAYVAFAMENPNHYKLMFMTPLPVQPDERLEKGNPEEDAYALLRGTVIEVMAAGKIRPELKDPELIAQAVWSGVHGVVSMHIAKRPDQWVAWRPVPRTARLVMDSMLEGLAPKESR
jgi:AcrR family transcriptional regulator